MTEPRASNPEVPEREARDARFFAWDVPGDANIVALVHESCDAERSATVVDAIATSIARRREHTLLLSADPGPTPLDELLGGAESEGLPAALGGRARLADVAVQRVDRPFVYLPAGPDPEAMQALLEDNVLASFVSRVRERGGTLFLVVSERTRLPAQVRELMDGYVALGEASLPNGADGLEPYGRVRFEEAPAAFAFEEDVAEAPDVEPAYEATHAPSDDTPVGGDLAPRQAGAESERSVARQDEPGETSEEPRLEPIVLSSSPTATAGGDWSRHRKRARPPAGLLGTGVVVVLGSFGGWYWFANRAGGGASSEQTPVTVELAEAAPAREALAPLDPADAGRVFETAPEVPFSVLIASYADRADADERLADLRSQAGGALFFASPTPVRGVIYHRVFAGAMPTEAEAGALMDRLVASGDKDEASAWHLRPVRLAFDLGLYVDAAGARARIADLEARGVSAYTLTASLDGRPVYQVYGGAYENERAALPMAEILDAAGEPATLIPRHGATETTPNS